MAEFLRIAMSIEGLEDNLRELRSAIHKVEMDISSNMEKLNASFVDSGVRDSVVVGKSRYAPSDEGRSVVRTILPVNL